MDRIINDSMNGPMDDSSIIKKQNDKQGIQATGSAESSEMNSGITGKGSATTTQRKDDKSKKETSKGGAAGSNGLVQAVTSIQKMLAQNTAILARIFGYLPQAANASVIKQTIETSRLGIKVESANSKVESAIHKEASGTKSILSKVLSLPRQIIDNSTINKNTTSRGLNLDFSRITKKIDASSRNRITNIHNGALSEEGPSILAILKEISLDIKASKATAKDQADKAAKEASFKAQFGNVASKSNASASANDNAGMFKGLKKAISGIGSSIMSGILAAKAKMWAFLIGLIGMIVAFIWLLVKYPKLREKLWGFVKGIGTKLWGMWMNFWENAGPKAKAIAIAIASLIGLIVFGPWGLLVGAVLLIASLWPKYKAQIIALGAIFAATAIAVWLFGPWGFIVLAIGALVMLVWAFKDKIWGWIKAIGSFIWTAVKVIGTILGAALLAILFGPIGIILAAWLVIRAFFPNLAKSIKNAIFGLLSHIPFVGKFFKGKGGEDEGDDKAEEEAKEAAKAEKEKTEEEMQPEEKSSGGGMFGGLFGGGESKPKPEASPVTSYNERQAHLARNNEAQKARIDAIAKISEAIVDLKTGNDQIIKSINASTKMEAGILAVISAAFPIIGVMLTQIQIQLGILQAQLMFATGPFTLIGAGMSAFSAVSKTVSNVFPKVGNFFGLNKDKEAEKDAPMRVIVISDESNSKSSLVEKIKEAAIKKVETTAWNDITMPTSIYNKAIETFGERVFETQPELVKSFIMTELENMKSAQASAEQATPNVSNNSLDVSEMNASSINSSSLINQKNQIETMKIQQNQREKAEKENASVLDDERENKKLEALPKVIALGLAEFFDARELTLKGATEPENILSIKNDDKASDF